MRLCPSVSVDSQRAKAPAQLPFAHGAAGAGADTAAVTTPAALSLAWGLVHTSGGMRAAALRGLSLLIAPPPTRTTQGVEHVEGEDITAATAQVCASAVEHGVPVV